MIGQIKEFCPIEKSENRQKGPISRKYRFIPFPVSDADDSSISFASLTENGDSEPKPAGDANQAAPSSASLARERRKVTAEACGRCG